MLKDFSKYLKILSIVLVHRNKEENNWENYEDSSKLAVVVVIVNVQDYPWLFSQYKKAIRIPDENCI